MKGAIDPRRLETFRVVATAGQISAAARQLHLSQPAVTAQIRQLEAEIGHPLFRRTPKGMVLNAEGRALLGYARKVHGLLEEARGALDTTPRGELVLAASTTVASYVLPSAIAAFVRAGRASGVRLEVGNTAEVLEHVREGRVPLGVVEGHARASGVRLERLLEDRLLPVVGASGPKPRRLEGLVDAPVIWREPGSGTRAVVERALRRAGLKRRFREGDLQLGGTEAIKRAAAEGLGVAFLSRWSCAAELAAGRLRVVELSGLTIARAFSWVIAGGEPGGTAGRFLGFVREHPPVLPG